VASDCDRADLDSGRVDSYDGRVDSYAKSFLSYAGHGTSYDARVDSYETRGNSNGARVDSNGGRVRSYAARAGRNGTRAERNTRRFGSGDKRFCSGAVFSTFSVALRTTSGLPRVIGTEPENANLVAVVRRDFRISARVRDDLERDLDHADLLIAVLGLCFHIDVGNPAATGENGE
jgi:hypothetical protein